MTTRSWLDAEGWCVLRPPGRESTRDGRFMSTLYSGLADLVFLLHIVFILFVLFGGLLALRWRRVPMAHLPAAAWGAAVEFFGWTCPLTPLEDALRRAGGSTASSVGFIERYLVPIVYPAALDRRSTGPFLARGL